MKIKIMSRSALERLAREPFSEEVAVVSIVDYADSPVSLENMPKFLHGVAFDDVDNDVIIDEAGKSPTPEERLRAEKKYHMISEADAMSIAEFYLSVRAEANTIICQCEHGQSRSAAVAAAMLEYSSGKGIKVFSSDSYYPNKVVFRRVLAALEKLGGRK